MNNVIKIDETAVTKFLMELAAETVWRVLYQEDRLARDHRKVAIAKSVAAQFGGVDFNAITADDYDEEHEDDPQDAAAFVRNFVAEAMWGVQYCERRLRDDHARLAGVKALLARIGSDIDLDKIWAEQSEKLNKTNKRLEE